MRCVTMLPWLLLTPVLRVYRLVLLRSREDTDSWTEIKRMSTMSWTLIPHPDRKLRGA